MVQLEQVFTRKKAYFMSSTLLRNALRQMKIAVSNRPPGREEPLEITFSTSIADAAFLVGYISEQAGNDKDSPLYRLERAIIVGFHNALEWTPKNSAK